MKEISLTSEIGNAWYNVTGPETDVILSSRVRLARNLVNFPFPSRFSHDDGLRIQSLVFDAFSKLSNPEQYQTLSVKKLDEIGKKILLERGVLSLEYVENPVAAIVVSTDGRLSCNVNADDHIQIATFCSGFDVDYIQALAENVDAGLQEVLQIAASVEFGYLTSKIDNMGTGIKLSVFAHLPSLAQCNYESHDLSSLFSDIESQGFSITPVFGLALTNNEMLSAAIGHCYQISTTVSHHKTEEDQKAAFYAIVKHIIYVERLVREKICESHPTMLRDSVYKALAIVKYSRLLTENEALDVLFRLKWGKDSGILTGIEDYQLSSLLYRIREGHISFINRSERFKFEKDISSTDMQIERLRSLIMQESTENIQIYS